MGISAVLIIVANVFVSYRGFQNRAFFEKYDFDIWKIKNQKEARRLLTSGFLHVNWGHLFLNMFALYSFSVVVESVVGTINYLILYFVSLLSGNVLALYIHRYHEQYRAVGASGAVCGIIFASIVMFPQGSISFLLLPIAIPSWLFGIGFILISIFGITVRHGNIGHEAHLGGAIAGVIVSILMIPELVAMHPFIIISIIVPASVFLIVLAKRPKTLLRDNYLAYKVRKISEKYETLREKKLQEELDRLLEKVHKKGLNGLSDGERKMLHDLSTRKRNKKST